MISSRTQKRILYHMANGWELKATRFGFAGGRWLQKVGEVIELPVDAEVELAIQEMVCLYRLNCYRIYALTPKGAELAKTISEADFQ